MRPLSELTFLLFWEQYIGDGAAPSAQASVSVGGSGSPLPSSCQSVTLVGNTLAVGVRYTCRCVSIGVCPCYHFPLTGIDICF